jgi:hypothetical protein
MNCDCPLCASWRWRFYHLYLSTPADRRRTLRLAAPVAVGFLVLFLAWLQWGPGLDQIMGW